MSLRDASHARWLLVDGGGRLLSSGEGATSLRDASRARWLLVDVLACARNGGGGAAAAAAAASAGPSAAATSLVGFRVSNSYDSRIHSTVFSTTPPGVAAALLCMLGLAAASMSLRF